MIIRTIVALLALLCAGGQAIADSVYWNYGIASVQVGYDKVFKGPVGYKISFVGIGPDDAPKKLGDCIAAATVAAGKSTWAPLDNYILDATQVADQMISRKETITPDTLRGKQALETGKTGVMIAYAEQLYRRSIEKCMGDQQAAQSVQLGIVSRLCVTWAPVGNECSQAREPVGRKQDPATGRYAKVYDWLVEKGALRPLNQIVQLVGTNGTVREIQPDLRDRYYIPAPTVDNAQQMFEDGAERFRRKGLRYDYIAAGVAKMDRSIAVALIDTVDHPVFVIPTLQDGHKKLVSASNELARTRLQECMFFQGNADLGKSAECAGVTGSPSDLAACINGGRCVVDLAQNAARAALSYTKAVSLKDLTLNSQLPRILGGTTFEQYKKAARACAQNSRDKNEFSYCLLKSQLTGKNAAVAQCIEASGVGAAARCVSDLMGDRPNARAAKCMLGSDDVRAKALCLASTTSSQAAQAYQCYQQNRNDKLAAAACVTSTNLPPEAKTVVSCATQFRSDYQSIATCMVGNNLGGDAQRLVGCYASSNGNWIGAGACLAGGELTAEQQILLQCATQTSMEPVSFGICTGGMLALKEFQQCRDKGFGEDNCFGENNEIRKFVRNIGLGDIDGNTVVGQVASLHLNALKATVSAAESLLGGVGSVAEGARDVFAALGGGLGDVADKTCDALGDLCPKKWKLFGVTSAPIDNLASLQNLPQDNQPVLGQTKAWIIGRKWDPPCGFQTSITDYLKPKPSLLDPRPCASGLIVESVENSNPNEPADTTSAPDQAESDTSISVDTNVDMRVIYERQRDPDSLSFVDAQALAQQAAAIRKASKDGTVRFGDMRVAIPLSLVDPTHQQLRSLGLSPLK